MTLGLLPSSAGSSSSSSTAPQKIALITGSNKGIGLEIARKLQSHKCDDDRTNNNAFVCILGCRNEELGRAAVEQLLLNSSEGEGTTTTANNNNNVDFVRIDLQDMDSIESAVKYIKEKYGRCDVLINNAAVCYNDPTLYGTVGHTPFDEQAEITVNTNFFGTLALTRAMLPLLLLKQVVSPRIINIASSAGRLSNCPPKKGTLKQPCLIFPKNGETTDIVKDLRLAVPCPHWATIIVAILTHRVVKCIEPTLEDVSQLTYTSDDYTTGPLVTKRR